MKRVTALFLSFVFCLAAGCSGRAPAVAAATRTPSAAPAQPQPTSPASSTSTPTTAPAPAVSASETPGNYFLADQGYDIANVRLYYPSPSEVQISFRYRINESDRARAHAIAALLPSSCVDTRSGDYPHFFMVPRDAATGEGSYDYQVKSEGGCDVDSFYLVMYSPYSSGSWPSLDAIVYRERIDKPLKLVRELPALDAKTLAVSHFAFHSSGPWSGVFSFDYAFSPEVAGLLGAFRFVVHGGAMSGIAGCDLRVSGPLVTRPKGAYEIPLDLRKDLPETVNGSDCRAKLEKYASLTYEQVWLSSEDETYVQYIDFRLRVGK